MKASRIVFGGVRVEQVVPAPGIEPRTLGLRGTTCVKVGLPKINQQFSQVSRCYHRLSGFPQIELAGC